jgi:anti-anti-sigma factor
MPEGGGSMGSPGNPGFAVRTDVRNGVARLALAGELDMYAAPILQDHIDQFASDGVAAVLLDLRELTFMDSTGLHVLLRGTDQASRNGHRLAIVGVGDATRRLLEITQTEGALIDETEGMELIRRFTQPEPAASDALPAGTGAGRDA